MAIVEERVGRVRERADEGRAGDRGDRRITGSLVGDLPPEVLQAEIVSLSRRLTVGTYELLVLVGELDERGAWAASGALTCAAWLAEVCGIEVSTARTQVRVARAMRRFGELDAAMHGGDISFAKARVLVPHLTAANLGDLLGLAVATPAGRLGAAIAAWAQRNEDPEEIRRRQHEMRSVTWRCDGDGMVSVVARLPPEMAAPVCAAVDQRVKASSAPAGASLAQQRADALVAVIGGGGAAVTTEVVVHVREGGNALTDGTPISDHAVAGMLPDAFVSLLIHDSQKRPIDASPRRRAPTRRQRRVIDERYPECARPGCRASMFLQYDHVWRWSDDGPTVIDNLRRLCGEHNREREERGR